MPRLHSSATPPVSWTRWAIRGLILVIACIIEPLILVYGSSTARGILAVLLPIAALIWMASTLLEYQRLRVQWQHEARQHAEVHNWNLIAEFLASVEQNTAKQPVDQ